MGVERKFLQNDERSVLDIEELLWVHGRRNHDDDWEMNKF
jgi:hypothetical protein